VAPEKNIPGLDVTQAGRGLGPELKETSIDRLKLLPEDTSKTILTA
jgi:hypothetical protein